MVTVSVNSTPPARKIATKVASRLRSLNNSNGTTGFWALRSAMTNAMKNTTAADIEPRVIGVSQPFSGPIEKPNTAAVQPSVARMAPVASSFIRSLCVSRRLVRAR